MCQGLVFSVFILTEVQSAGALVFLISDQTLANSMSCGAIWKGVGSVRAEWESQQKLYCISPQVSSRHLSASVSLHTEDDVLIGNENKSLIGLVQSVSVVILTM